jgi:hypothetical protein
MNTIRRNEKVAGVLMIAGIVAGILSIAPSVEAPDFLTNPSANEYQISTAAIFQLIMSFTYLGVAFILYPVLEIYNKSLAIGFLSFRIAAAVLIVIGVIPLLLLLTLSQEYVKAVPHDSLVHFQTLGRLLRTSRDLVNHVFMILILSVGGLMFYSILIHSKLVPRWLSVWGFSGTILAMVASLLVMFRSIEIITPIYISLNMPIALLEIVLAIWLIVKGFDTTVLHHLQIKYKD